MVKKMDRIKKALEASKLAREKSKHKDKLPKQVIPQDLLEQEVGKDSVVNKDTPEQFVINNKIFAYEQTRVVTLNQEHLAKNRIVAFNKNNRLSLGFDILRTQVIDKMLKNGWRTLAVTSPIPACGKTMVSINLAMSIAHYTDKTAMLVDFDLRQPSVAKYLGLTAGSTLNDVLAGDASIEESLVNPELDRLVILPTAMPVKHSSEVLSSRKVKNLISEFRERYEERIVIFDLPPLLGTDDAMTMLSQVDCVLVVVGNGMVSKTDLVESMRYVDQAKLLGTILNKAKISQSQRGYYDY